MLKKIVLATVASATNDRRTRLRKPLMKLMGASDEVIAGLATGQRQVVDQVIDFIETKGMLKAA